MTDETRPTDEAITSALTQRATDLARAIDNPATLSKKLRESLVDIVGPDAAVAWHISGAYNNGEVQFQIARLSPNLVAELTATEHGADLGLAWRRTTESGWQVAVGATVKYSRREPMPRLTSQPKSSAIMAAFSVTITR